MSNLLAMPLINAVIETYNNEDWLDAFVYVVPPPADATAPQLDLRGIDFEMDVRHNALDHEVVLTASTVDGSLSIGLPPNYGYLIIYKPLAIMATLPPGSYVADIIGTDGNYQRTCIEIALTVFEGITR